MNEIEAIQSRHERDEKPFALAKPEHLEQMRDYQIHNDRGKLLDELGKQKNGSINMSDNKTICPLMSKPGAPVECIRHQCQFWRTVYSTEGLSQPYDCIIALEPQMVDGVLRV